MGSGAFPLDTVGVGIDYGKKHREQCPYIYFFRVIGYFYAFYRLYFSIFHVFFPRIRYRAVGKSRGCLHNAFYTGKYFLHSIVGSARKIQVFHGNSSFSAVFVSDKFISYFMVKMKNPPEVLPRGFSPHLLFLNILFLPGGAQKPYPYQRYG